MTPHKHAEMIKAWADGHPVQYKSRSSGEWVDLGLHISPGWEAYREYRIKPKELFVNVFKTEENNTNYRTGFNVYSSKEEAMSGNSYRVDWVGVYRLVPI